MTLSSFTAELGPLVQAAVSWGMGLVWLAAGAMVAVMLVRMVLGLGPGDS